MNRTARVVSHLMAGLLTCYAAASFAGTSGVSTVDHASDDPAPTPNQ